MSGHAIPRLLAQAELSQRLQLTPRELQILRCAARGLSGNETARELWLAPQTIKFHKTNLYRKMGAKSIGHAIALAYQRGLLYLEGDPEPPTPVVEIDGVLYAPMPDEKPA